MPGASCVKERCAFIGKARGTIRFQGSPPKGRLRVVAYPASAFMHSIGPAPAVHAVGSPIEIDSPEFPQAYELGKLPKGALQIYAFIEVHDDAKSKVRACKGDIMGLSPLTLVGGGAMQKAPDLLIQFPVTTDLFCK
jgi:hypothetical protein